ncbi:MAG: hypothetical protein ACRD8O_05400 [Bryobacteraceae bacterium]
MGMKWSSLRPFPFFGLDDSYAGDLQMRGIETNLNGGVEVKIVDGPLQPGTKGFGEPEEGSGLKVRLGSRGSETNQIFTGRVTRPVVIKQIDSQRFGSSVVVGNVMKSEANFAEAVLEGLELVFDAR